MNRCVMEQKSKKLSASLEDYIEVIFHLIGEHRVARAKDVADKMAVRKSSVTGALKALSEKGYINHDPYN